MRLEENRFENRLEEDMGPPTEISVQTAKRRFIQTRITVFYAGGAGPLLREEQGSNMREEEHILKIRPEVTGKIARRVTFPMTGKNVLRTKQG